MKYDVRTFAAGLALAAGLAAAAPARAATTTALAPLPLPTRAPAAVVSPARAAQEAPFLRHVKLDFTANEMTANVPYFTGKHVAFDCELEERERPTVVVGQCGRDEEPVDLFLELPANRYNIGDKLRILGIVDNYASWSDVSGHTVYYPFIKAVYIDPIALKH